MHPQPLFEQIIATIHKAGLQVDVHAVGAKGVDWTLDAFAGAVRRLLGERLVVLKLFGSHARGEAAPDSDLDVLVAVEEASPALENQILDLAFQVNLAHDVYISPRVIARSVFADPV